MSITRGAPAIDSSALQAVLGEGEGGPQASDHYWWMSSNLHATLPLVKCWQDVVEGFEARIVRLRIEGDNILDSVLKLSSAMKFCKSNHELL